MKTYPSRFDMVNDLPAGVGVEVGVQRGDFAAEILRTNVKKLHLVDAWQQIGGRYSADPADVSNREHEANCMHVHERFKAERESRRVKIHRRKSVDAAGQFEDGSLDWVYLDADHTFPGLSLDFIVWRPKIRPGGCIMGHDYCENFATRKMGFEVVEAVKTFCALKAWELVAVTSEEWPSFKVMKT